jgi:hypothetical protein
VTPPQIKDGEGWPFRLIGRVPYHPDSIEDWLEAVNNELFRQVDASENLNHSEHESYHNGDK